MGRTKAHLIFVLAVAPVLAQDATPGVPPEEAWRDVGKTEAVCGQVVDTASPSGIKDAPAYLYIGRPRPDQVFTAIIPYARRAMFAESPEKSLRGKRICVTGMIEKDPEKGIHRARMFLEEEEQIVVE